MNLHPEKPAALVQHWHFSLKFKPMYILYSFTLMFRDVSNLWIIQLFGVSRWNRVAVTQAEKTWALWWKYELEDSPPRRQQTGGLWKHDGWQITVSVGSLGRVCKESSCESSILLERSQCSCRRVSGNDISWFLRNGYTLIKSRASTI